MSIHLGQNSRFGSSCLPGSGVGSPKLPYLALHRIRHSWLPMSPSAPVVSYTTISPLRSTIAMSSIRESMDVVLRGLFLWS